MKNHFIDEQKLATILARAEAATAGPWRSMIEGRDHTSGSSFIATAMGGIDLDGASDADIEFLANAREDIPYLISEIRKLAET